MDIRIEDHGSIVLLRPMNEGACRWLDGHIDPDLLSFGNAIACEPRYLGTIVEGARADGLKVR